MSSTAPTKKKRGFGAFFENAAAKATKAAGSPAAFVIAFLLIVAWGVSGPLFNYSDTWQLVINTGTTIITFLMVFIIQQTQNKDSLALQLKLNELIACEKEASNRLIDVEDLSSEELEVLKKFYVKLATLAKKENSLHTSHSVDEADAIQAEKNSSVRTRTGKRKKKTES